MFVYLVTTSFVLFIYYVTTKKHGYWRKKGVPYLKPLPLFGNYKDYIFLKKHSPQVAQEICQHFPEAPYVGSYVGPTPSLIVQDPEFVKLVLAKDFYYFNARELPGFSHRELLTQNLFFVYGDTWKVIRHHLKPLFSLAKMKNMFYLIAETADKFEKVLKEEISRNSSIDTLDLSARYTIEGIASCIFGVNPDTLDEKNNPFCIVGNKIMISSTFRAFKLMFRAMWPQAFYGLRLSIYDTKIYNFLFKVLTGVFETRHYKPTSRNDFVDLILNWKEKKYLVCKSIDHDEENKKTVKLKVNDSLLVAQCSMMFGAGYDTSAMIISLTLFELAKNSDLQQQVLGEVDHYLIQNNGMIKYSCVFKMPLLDACIDEALRMYPVAGLMPREVTEDYTFPTGLHLEKGAKLHIPVFHIHRNPKYHPDPETFRPERFLGRAKENILPFSYIPFGEGPRLCLGIRFAKMQMIAGLMATLRNFEVELADNMSKEIMLDPRGIITQIKGGIYLKFLERNK